MTDIHKVRAKLGAAGAVLALALVYLFGLSPESKQMVVLLDVAKVAVGLLLFSAFILFTFLWSDDFYRTPYSLYMESLWDSWGLNGVSLCRSYWLGSFTLCLWIGMLVCAYAMLHTAYLVGMGGYEHFFGWREHPFWDNVATLAIWSGLSNLVFAGLYCALVLSYKINKATISFLSLFVALCISAVWILGSIQTFGWEGVLLALYWMSVVFLGFCISVVVIYALFLSLNPPTVALIQSLRGVKEGFCPIIPRITKKEKPEKDFDSIE